MGASTSTWLVVWFTAVIARSQTRSCEPTAQSRRALAKVPGRPVMPRDLIHAGLLGRRRTMCWATARPRCVGQVKGSCADGSVFGDGDWRGDAGVGFGAGFDEGAAVDAVGDEDGGGAGAAEDDAAGADVELAGDVEGAGAEEDCTAEGVGLEREGGDVVDGVLQERGVVFAGGADGDYGFDCGDGCAGGVACGGEVDGDGVCLREGVWAARESAMSVVASFVMVCPSGLLAERVERLGRDYLLRGPSLRSG